MHSTGQNSTYPKKVRYPAEAEPERQPLPVTDLLLFALQTADADRLTGS